MRLNKGFYISAIAMIILVAAVSIWRILENPGKKSNERISIEYDKSYFHDFHFDKNGNVVFRCSVYINNPSDKEVDFGLKIDVKREKARGLVKNDFAFAYEPGTMTLKKMSLGPMAKQTYNVMFYAKAGKTKTKQDRLLPGKISEIEL